jgi:hypothetical protein
MNEFVVIQGRQLIQDNSSWIWTSKQSSGSAEKLATELWLIGVRSRLAANLRISKI